MMKNLIAGILVPLSNALYELVLTIPMWMVRVGVFGILALLALWVLRMPPQLPEHEENGGKVFWKDLRLFALGVLVLQAVLYVIF